MNQGHIYNVHKTECLQVLDFTDKRPLKQENLQLKLLLSAGGTQKMGGDYILHRLA